jgi:hypothetical protein
MMAMAHAVHSGGRAEELVDRLRADWRGKQWDDVVIDDVRLLSPGDQWPPVIRLDYRIGDKPGRWVEAWDGQTFSTESLEAASGLWQAIVSIHLMDLDEPPADERP